LFRLAPRLVIAGWVALVTFLLLVEVRPLFQLDPRVVDISPFTHVPKLPGGELTMTPLVWLTAIAVAPTTIGLAGFRRRDVG
jgi:polyether ionophore transport system permease protein